MEERSLESTSIPANLLVSDSSGVSCNEPQDASQIRSMADYEVVREVGEGSFSVVYYGREKNDPGREVALKMCFKRQILKEKRVASVHREKEVLAMLSTKERRHPFIVTLYATFQDSDHLYFVLNYAKYGDLLHVMQKQPGKVFSVNASRLYSAQLLSALQHLHNVAIVHRDVKPENILVKADGHILLSDFGSVKVIEEKTDQKPVNDLLVARTRRSSFVGTAQYVSPEILTGDAVTAACDLWAFAVVLYQFLTGRHCFHDESEYLMYRRIQKLLFSYPDNFPADAKDLIDRILVIKPTDRLGTESCGGPEAIRTHSFFAGLQWKDLHLLPAPVRPLDLNGSG